MNELGMESCKRPVVAVAKGSVIHLHRNVYSVHSRLLGQRQQHAGPLVALRQQPTPRRSKPRRSRSRPTPRRSKPRRSKAEK
jgi:hypothetical protein